MEYIEEPGEDDLATLQPVTAGSPEEWVRAQAWLWFGDEGLEERLEEEEKSDGSGWTVALGERLMRHATFRALLEVKYRPRPQRGRTTGGRAHRLPEASCPTPGARNLGGHDSRGRPRAEPAGLGGYTGILLGTLGARAMWNSSLLGPLFLVSGLSTGAAFMMLFSINHDEHKLLRRWDLAAIGLEVILLGLFFLGLVTGGGEAGQRAVSLIFGGKYTAPFWALVVAAGLAVPFLLELLESRKGFKPTRVAPVLILVGGLALRWIIVSAGQV